MLANVLTNAGTVNWAPSGGTFYVQNNNANVRGAIYNLAGALWDLQIDQNISCYFCGASELFNNAGTVRKSGGTGTTCLAVGFYNSGVVSVLAGTLSLGGGGTVEGTFNASAGIFINWSGGVFSYSTVPALNGPGKIQMTGGSLTLASNVIPNLGMAGGTLSLGAGFQGGTITNLTLGDSTLNGNYAVSGTFNLIWSHRLQVDGSQGNFLVSAIEDLIIRV